jgi:hypothetical protein
MPLPEVYTYCDAVDALIEIGQSYGRSAPQSVLRRAIRAARDEIIAAHQWPFLLANAPILLRARQTTGTVVYDHTGGTSERQLTLTGATWPEAWVADAAVRFDDTVCDVQEYVDSTNIILDSVMNPGQDVASTSYVLYPRWYPLPADFGSIVRVAEKSSWKLGHEISLREMMARDKYITGGGDPNYYAIGPTQDQLGSMALYLHIPSDTTERIDLLYRRRFRDLRYSGHNAAEFAGTISVTAGSPTVTGSASTSFESGMVNSILRISSSTDKPTGLEGTNAWAEQRVIKSVASTTSLTLDADVSTTRSARKYVISDPVEVAPGVWPAFLACAAKHYAITVNFKEKGELVAAYREALFSAKQAANVSTAPQVAHIGPTYMGRLADSTDRSEVP